MIISILGYIVAGLAAGFLSGFLGIGGGVVIIPTLLALFSFAGLGDDPMHLAIGTSLAGLTLSSFSSFYSHYRKKNILPGTFKALLPTACVGSFIGVFITVHMPENILRLLFALLEVGIGIHFIRNAKKEQIHQHSISQKMLAFVGLSVSTVSAMLGIGGGVLGVPILTTLGATMKKSIGSSAALSFAIMTTGAIGFFFLTDRHLQSTSGGIYLPAAISIMIAATIAAPVGAHCSHIINTKTIKRIFGYFLLALGAMLLLTFFKAGIF